MCRFCASSTASSCRPKRSRTSASSASSDSNNPSQTKPPPHTPAAASCSDAHVGIVPAQEERLRPVYAANAWLAPDFVMHCGEIWDTGLPGEDERYGQTVPLALRGRIRHVPGIHEVRWDPTAKGLSREQF